MSRARAPRVTAVLVAVGLVCASGCQVSPPGAGEPRPAIPAEVYRRFELDPARTEELLEPIHVLGRSEQADEEAVDAPSASIELDDVLASVDRHFPLILAAQEEIAIAEGKLLAAEGGFDLLLGGDGKFKVEAGRESDVLDVFLAQPTTLWGASFETGYRVGRGDFFDYEKDAQTFQDGELRLGVTLPLLQDRAIDSRRVKLWRARLERERADPQILAKRLEVARKATESYWKWVAAGRLREIALRLLALADDRTEQLQQLVQEGELAEIDLTENERLVVTRRAALLRAERALQEAAIQLSLFWRDAEGRATVPGDELLPYDFPLPRPAEEVLLDDDVEFALARRPELRAVTLELEQLGLDAELARNALLPALDVGVFASQDEGPAAGASPEKGDFELELEVKGSVPIQRRGARGATRELEAKLRKLEREQQFLRDTIQADVQDVRSALQQSWLGIAQARESVRLANALADAERRKLEFGQSDLLRINLQEQQAANAAATYVSVLRSYYQALAAYRAVLGVPNPWELPTPPSED